MLNRDEEESLTLALLLYDQAKKSSFERENKIEKYENNNDLMHVDYSSNFNRQNTTN